MIKSINDTNTNKEVESRMESNKTQYKIEYENRTQNTGDTMSDFITKKQDTEAIQAIDDVAVGRFENKAQKEAEAANAYQASRDAIEAEAVGEVLYKARKEDGEMVKLRNDLFNIDAQAGREVLDKAKNEADAANAYQASRDR